VRRDILEELRISRKVIRGGEELTPRFLVYTPTVDAISLPAPTPATLRGRCEFVRALRKTALAAYGGKNK
jgi:hypothetical protein